MPSAIRVIDQLAELADVTLAGLADNDILQYDSVTSKWNNTAFASIGFVPYTGATANLDLGAFDFTTTGTGYFAAGLVDNLDIYSIDPVGRGLYYSTGTDKSIDWNSSLMYDSAGGTSLGWNIRYLYDLIGTLSLNWNERKLIANDGTDVILNWTTAGTAAFDNTNITTTGNITGNGITDNGLTVSLAVYTDGSKQLTSTAPTSGVIGYWSRTGAILTPTTSGDAIKVDEIYDTSGNISIAVDTRFLQADDEAISVKYDDRILASGAGAVTSVDWDDRQLVASDGADVVLDWSTAGAADFINSNITTSGTLNSTSATAGQSIIASGLVVNNDGDGAVTDDFVAKTTSKANAFQVDASDDQINLNVVENYQWTMGTGSDDPTTDAPVDWIQIEIAGVVRYIPVYA